MEKETLKNTTIMDYLTQKVAKQEITLTSVGCEGDIDIIGKFPLTLSGLQHKAISVKVGKLLNSKYSSIEVITKDEDETKKLNRAIDKYIEVKLGIRAAEVAENITMLELYRLVALNLKLSPDERLLLNVFDINLF